MILAGQPPRVSTASEGLVNLTLTNCGTATQNVLAAGTDAIGPGGRWQLTPQTGTGICPLGENKYSLLALGPLGGGPRGIANYLANSPTPLGNDSGVPFPFPPSPAAATTINFFLTMPCQGSVGAGLTQTLSATFTAVVA